MSTKRRRCSSNAPILLADAPTGGANGACNPFASGDAEPEVCPESEREVLVAEALAKNSPSTPFTGDASADVWVGLMADSDYSASALFSQVTGLYVISGGDAGAYTRDDLDFVVTDDPYVDFDRLGQFVPFEFAPGTYQVWSTKTPQIAVVAALAPTADDLAFEAIAQASGRRRRT